jgi:hypothetical protein
MVLLRDVFIALLLPNPYVSLIGLELEVSLDEEPEALNSDKNMEAPLCFLIRLAIVMWWYHDMEVTIDRISDQSVIEQGLGSG